MEVDFGSITLGMEGELTNTRRKGRTASGRTSPESAHFIYPRRHLALASNHGHVSTMDWQAGKLHSELQLGESVRDIK